MIGFDKSDDYQPVAWIGRHPIYSATALVILHAATAILVTILMALSNDWIFDYLNFSSSAVSDKFQIWRFITYAFIDVPSLSLVINLAMLYWFGRQVERFIGRRDFLALYGFLLILPPCVLMALGAFAPVQYEGTYVLNFSIFLAFATLYPNVEIFFSIKAKWIAGCVLAVYLLQTLANHNWVTLLVLSLSAFTAFFFIGRLRYGFELPGLHHITSWFARMRRRNSNRRGISQRPRSLPGPTDPGRARHEELLVTVDSLLEKISRTGISSLSAKEREQLARASEELKRRERHVSP